VNVAYVALDETGREVTGGLEAADLPGAAAALRGRGLFPVELSEGAAAAAPPARSARRGSRLPGVVRARDLALLCDQLALMLRTGLTLLQALDVLGEQLEKARLRRAMRRVSERVQGGAAFSDALDAEGRLFPALVVQLVRTAEATGELDQAFARAADWIERRASLRLQILTSLTYPAIVVLVCCGVFWFLAAHVVPKLARFLAGRGVALPWTTQLLLDVSEAIRSHGLAIGLGLAVLAAGLLAAYRTPGGRLRLDRAALRLPVVGGVLRAAAMAHLSRTLGLLLRSGLPLLDSLRLLAPTFANRSHRAALEEAHERVLRGASLRDGLAGPGVTPLARQVVGVGEQTGALDEVLLELADHYDGRLAAAIKTLSSLIEPALLLVVGGMVGFVYLSFFQAVFQLVAR